jgi:DNA-binding MarR family transcriptional regulator
MYISMTQRDNIIRSKRQTRRKAEGVRIKKGPRDTYVGAVDYEALAEFRYRLRVFVAFADANAKNVGLTSQQYQALLAIEGLSGQKPMLVGHLAKLLLIKHHTAVELVDRMTKLDLVQRSVDVNDNRRVLVTLTRKGRRLLQKVASVNFKHLGSSGLALSKISKLLS